MFLRALTGILLLTVVPTPGRAQGPELVFEIGALDGPSWQLWQRIEDAVLVGGVVFVVDISIPAVRAFGSRGTYLGELGGGQGPGEFVRPSGAAPTPGGVMVTDFAQQRTVLVSPGDLGELSTTRSAYPPVSGVLMIQPMSHGWHVGRVGPVWRRDDQSLRWHVLAWTGTRVDTVASYASNHVRRLYEGEEGLRHSAWVTPGAAGDWWPVDSTRVVGLMDGTDVGIYTMSEDGLVLASSFALPGTHGRLTEDQQSDWESWRLEAYGPPTGHRESRFEYPETFPPWVKVRGSGVDGLWFMAGGLASIEPQLEREVWVQFNPSGREVRRLEMPLGVEVLRIQGESLLAVRTDEFQVEYFQLYRISGA